MKCIMLGERIPPHHNGAERAVLGAVLRSSEAVLTAHEALHPEDFYSPAHREIFDAMFYLVDHSRPVDLVTLDEELTRRGKLSDVGGLQALIKLSRLAPSGARLSASIKIVNEKAMPRKLIEASSEIGCMRYTGDQETEGAWNSEDWGTDMTNRDRILPILERIYHHMQSIDSHMNSMMRSMITIETRGKEMS